MMAAADAAAAAATATVNNLAAIPDGVWQWVKVSNVTQLIRRAD